jgi:2-iminobutanoate/2-iminopropanoate deaminase
MSVAEFVAGPFEWAQDAPFTPAVVVGNLVFLAGHAPIGDDGEVVDGDFETQLRQCYGNLSVTLKSVGSDLSSLVSITAMLSDLADYDAYKRIRSEYLTPPYPAAAGFVATMLYPKMRVGLVHGIATVPAPSAFAAA